MTQYVSAVRARERNNSPGQVPIAQMPSSVLPGTFHWWGSFAPGGATVEQQISNHLECRDSAQPPWLRSEMQELTPGRGLGKYGS